METRLTSSGHYALEIEDCKNEKVECLTDKEIWKNELSDDYQSKVKLLADEPNRDLAIALMDGNFKMSPKNFLQLYVIHVPLGPHNSVPVVYAFMEQKSFDSYCELFDVIMNKATEFGLVLQPDLVIVDFEIATHQALRQRIDVNISIGGCFFHKRGSTWQKVQDLGEVERYVLQCSNDTPGMYI